ncbi:MAG: hypothetical protein WCG67_02445 [Ferruginibacter sp.]
MTLLPIAERFRWLTITRSTLYKFIKFTQAW